MEGLEEVLYNRDCGRAVLRGTCKLRCELEGFCFQRVNQGRELFPVEIVQRNGDVLEFVFNPRKGRRDENRLLS